MNKIILISLISIMLAALTFVLLPALLAVWLAWRARQRRSALCSLGYDYERAEPARYDCAEQSIDDYLRWLLTR